MSPGLFRSKGMWSYAIWIHNSKLLDHGRDLRTLNFELKVLSEKLSESLFVPAVLNLLIYLDSLYLIQFSCIGPWRTRTFTTTNDCETFVWFNMQSHSWYWPAIRRFCMHPPWYRQPCSSPLLVCIHSNWLSFQYGNKLGHHMAQLILAHREAGTVFNINYSRGTENVAVTAVRLGEIDANEGEAIKVNSPCHRWARCWSTFVGRRERSSNLQCCCRCSGLSERCCCTEKRQRQWIGTW
jgi:hypothetical protein